MREILFKAKRKDNGEWVEGGYLCEPYTDKKFIICWNSFGLGFNEFIEIDPDTLCQYTGLTDKDDKKIWENDIVELPEEDGYFKCEWEEDTASRVLNEFARQGISEEEKRQQDLLHEIEFETSSRKRGPIDTKLHKCRVARREYKDTFEETDEIVKFFGEKQNQKCLNDMKQLLGRLRKVEKYHENRVYIPRMKD